MFLKLGGKGNKKVTLRKENFSLGILYSVRKFHFSIKKSTRKMDLKLHAEILAYGTQSEPES